EGRVRLVVAPRLLRRRHAGRARRGRAAAARGAVAVRDQDAAHPRGLAGQPADIERGSSTYEMEEPRTTSLHRPPIARPPCVARSATASNHRPGPAGKPPSPGAEIYSRPAWF